MLCELGQTAPDSGLKGLLGLALLRGRNAFSTDSYKRFLRDRAGNTSMVFIMTLLPTVAFVGMMTFGGGMMAQMNMSSGAMALCLLWALLVAAALVFLIVLMTRGTPGAGRRDLPAANIHSPLPS